MRYIVEIDGARHEVELDQGMATVDGGPAVPVSLDALPGTPVHLVRVDGEVLRIGGKCAEAPGYDLMGVITGSEGLLGVITEVTVRILRKPETARALMGVTGVNGADVKPAFESLKPRLTDVTRRLRHRDPDAALAAVGLDGRQRFNGASNSAGAASTLFNEVIRVRNIDVDSAEFVIERDAPQLWPHEPGEDLVLHLAVGSLARFHHPAVAEFRKGRRAWLRGELRRGLKAPRCSGRQLCRTRRKIR